MKLDMESTALVVIDLQKGIVRMPVAPNDAKTVIANAAALAGAFRKRGMQVFLVRVMLNEKERLEPVADQQSSLGDLPKDWSEIVPELGPEEGDVVITKKQWGAFYGTELGLQLRRRGIRTIVLSGISTNIGVESTARFAYEHAYQQIFAKDAMAARSEEEHNHSIKFIFGRIGRVRKTAEILEALR